MEPDFQEGEEDGEDELWEETAGDVEVELQALSARGRLGGGEMRMMTREGVLQELQTSATNGLTPAEARERRVSHGTNVLRPPLACPAWLCCVLPCLANTPGVLAFHDRTAQTTHVLRAGQGWVHMDTPSLVIGDIVRVSTASSREQAVIPADLRVLEIRGGGTALLDCAHVAAAHGSATVWQLQSLPRSSSNNNDSSSDCLDDSQNKESGGRGQPRESVYNISTLAPMGGIMQRMDDTCSRERALEMIGVVVAVGPQTLMGHEIAAGRWGAHAAAPPHG